MKYLRAERRFFSFTLIDLLMTIVIMMILMSILMPSLVSARQRAKFTRWYAFNKLCSRDPDCVVNYDFQELVTKADGDYLRCTSEGCDSANYVGRDYDGQLKSSDSDTEHSFGGLVDGGRWSTYKKALQFNGADTYVKVAGTGALDFSPKDDFTIIVSCRFDEFNLGDGLFSKSMWGSSFDTSCQYDLYCDNPDVGGAFEVDVFTSCVGWDSSDVDFDEDAGWFSVAMRYKYISTSIQPDGSEKVEGETTVFVNGQALGPARETNNDISPDWQECSDAKVNLILGAIGSRDWRGGGIIYNYTGRMDEFLLYKRALSDAEIRGVYEMGKE